MNGHDLHGGSGGVRDGLWALVAQLPYRHHASVHGRSIVARIVANRVHDGQPSLGELPLSIIGIGDQKVRLIQQKVEGIVDSAPLNELAKTEQKGSNALGWSVFQEVSQHLTTLLQGHQRLVHLLLGHANNRGASKFNAGSPRGGAGHQRQDGHQGLDDGLHQEKPLPVGHHRNVSGA